MAGVIGISMGLIHSHTMTPFDAPRKQIQSLQTTILNLMKAAECSLNR